MMAEILHNEDYIPSLVSNQDDTNLTDRVHPNFVNTSQDHQQQQTHVSETYDLCLQNKVREQKSFDIDNSVSAVNMSNGDYTDVNNLLHENNDCSDQRGENSILQTKASQNPEHKPEISFLTDIRTPVNGNSNFSDCSSDTFAHENSNISNVYIASSDVQGSTSESQLGQGVYKFPSKEFLYSEIDTESQESFSGVTGAHSFIRKELLAALSHDADNDSIQRAATPDTDSLSMATSASFDADGMEDEILLKSNSKTKQGRRTKKWLDDDDKEPLSYELKIGARILGEFMVEANRSLTWPFMNKVDPERDGVPDYYSHIKRPVWFNGMKEKFINREYDGIDQFVSDFRTMLQNCYRYNGPDHAISKKAQRLETMLDQKLSLLSRDLREKIEQKALASSSKSEKGTGSRRRRHIVPHDSTALLNQLRLEQAEREREARRMHLEERRQLAEIQSRMIDEWETTLFTDEQRRRMKAMCELPQIGHLLFLCQGTLNVGEIAQWELERCFLMPKQSNTMQRVMTTLLSTPYQRNSLDRKPLMPYKVWEDKLRTRSNIWYKALKETNDISKAAEKCGIEEKFFKVLGLKNPLNKMKFDELSYYQRVWIIKALCEWCLDKQECLRESIEAQPSVEQHEYVLGEDAKGFTYIHFPQFCGADLRVYRQAPYDIPEFEIEAPPPSSKKSKKGKQKLSVRWAAARRKLLAEKAREKARLEKLAAAEEAENEDDQDEQATTSVASRKSSTTGAQTSDEEESNDGESDNESDGEPAKKRKSTSSKSSSTPAHVSTRKTRSTRRSSPGASRSSSRSRALPAEEEMDEAEDPVAQAAEGFVATGRVTRSAWKKSIEETATPGASSGSRKRSSQRSRKRNKVASRSPSPSPAKRPSRSTKSSKSRKTRDEESEEEEDKAEENVEDAEEDSSITETKEESISNHETNCDIKKDGGTIMDSNQEAEACEKPTTEHSEKDDEIQMNDETKEDKETEASIADDDSSMHQNGSIDDKLKSEGPASFENDGKNCSDDKMLCDNNEDTQSNEASVVESESKQNSDEIKEHTPHGDDEQLNELSENDMSNSANEQIAKNEERGIDEGEQVQYKNAHAAEEAVQSGEGILNEREDEHKSSDKVEASEKQKAVSEERKSPNDLSDSSQSQNGMMELSVTPTPFSSYCSEGKVDNLRKSNATGSSGEKEINIPLANGAKECDTVKDQEFHDKNSSPSQKTEDKEMKCEKASEDTPKDSVDNGFKQTETTSDNQDKTDFNAVQSVSTNDSNSHSEQNTQKSAEDAEKEIAEIMMSMSRNVVTNADEANSTLDRIKKEGDLSTDTMKKEECSSGYGDDEKATEGGKAAAKDEEGKSEIKEETKEGQIDSKIKKEEEEEEEDSELDEPEIKEPEYDSFELICETVEELRELTETFAPPSPKKRKVSTAPTRQPCEVNLYSRLSYLLKELEPWEAKLLQLNRRMRTKMKREMENYVEEQIKESMWESESSSSESESEGGGEDDTDVDYTDPSAPALRPPRKRKTATPTPDTDRYMDQSEEYGYSSKGRMRKRRIIPNNAEDQCAPKKPPKQPTRRKPGHEPALDPPTPPPSLPSSKPAPSHTAPKPDRSISPSKMQHLIFQQPDGKRFTINDTQTLLLRAPSTTPGGPSQLIQIPGSVAVRNPGVLSQFLNSNKLGPGGATLIVQNNEPQAAANTSQVLKEHLTKRAAATTPRQPHGTPTTTSKAPVHKTPTPSAAGIKSPPPSAFPAFEFKSSTASSSSTATMDSASAMLKSVALSTSGVTKADVPMPKEVVSCVSAASGVSAASTASAVSVSVNPGVAVAASPVKTPAKHTPRILLSPKTQPPTTADKPMTFTQLPANVMNQLPPNIIRQLIAAKQQTLHQQQQGNQAAAVNIAIPQQIALQLQGAQAQGQIALQGQAVAQGQSQIAAGVVKQAVQNVASAQSIHPPSVQKVVTISGANIHVGSTSLTASQGASAVPTATAAIQKPKYSSNVTVKELLERQVASNMAAAEKGQGEIGGNKVNPSPIKLAVRPLPSGDSTLIADAKPAIKMLNFNQTNQGLGPLKIIEGGKIVSRSPVKKAPTLERSDTREAAEALISLEAQENSDTVSSSQEINKPPTESPSEPMNTTTSLQPSTTIPSSPLRTMNETSIGSPLKQIGSPLKNASGAANVQKVAVLKGGKSVAVVNAAKLQELIARKEAIDEAVKQVITEVPTTLPTVQIKVSSPYALSGVGRQSVRPCTAATMALKHPIPAVPAVATLTKTHARRGGASTSVSASVAYEVSTSQTLTVASQMTSAMHTAGVTSSLAGIATPIVTSQVQPDVATVTTTSPLGGGGVARAPTALVSVKTTPLIHATEAAPVVINHANDSSPTKVATTKPQTVQVVTSDKNMTYRLAQQGSSSQQQQSAPKVVPSRSSSQVSAKQISPTQAAKGLNLAKLREQGIVLVRTANGQLQLMQTTPSSSTGGGANKVAGNVAIGQPTPVARSVSDTSIGLNQANALNAQSAQASQGGAVLNQSRDTHQIANSEQAASSLVNAASAAALVPKIVAVNKNQLSGQPQQGNIQPRIVLQNQVGQSVSSHIQTQSVSSQIAQQSATTQLQTPRLVLQAPNPATQPQPQLTMQPAVNQLQQPMAMLAGSTNQVQQPRLVLVNVNGQLMAQAVPQQLNPGAARIQAVTPAAAASGGIQLLSQPATSVMQPAVQLAQQPASIMNQLQLSQALNVVRGPQMVVQQALQQQTPLVVPGAAAAAANIQGPLLVPGAANIQAPLVALQGGTGQLMLQGPGGVMGLVAPQASTPAQQNQVLLNLNNVFQGQK